jgi:hypothetical protein
MDGIQYYNRLLNCVDIGKDAAFQGLLSEKTHGNFLRDAVLTPIFNLDSLEPKDKLIARIGDNSNELKKRMDAKLRLANHQQLFTLRFDSNGYDSRIKDIAVAYDSGGRPETLFAEYTLVLNPSSLLDPAKRNKTHEPQHNTLSQASELSAKALEELDVGGTLKSVKYNGDFSFNIETTIPGHTKSEFKFSKTTFAAKSDFFKGNKTKNKFISEHWENAGKIPDIQMYILAKETLGDTAQVAWLKQTVEDSGGQLNKDTTALCTKDTTLWLRSILNDVSCFYTNGGVTTYYTAAADEANKAMMAVKLKDRLIHGVEKNHSSAIHIVEIFCGKVLTEGITFQALQLNEAHRYFLLQVGRILAKRMRDVSKEIITKLKVMNESNMDDFRRFIDRHSMHCPFILTITSKDIRFRLNSEYVIPEGDEKIQFLGSHIYNKVRGRKSMDEKDIEIIFGGKFTPSTGGGGSKSKTQQHGGYQSENPEDLEEILSANKDIPGFIPYFIFSYMRELLYIGYAYAKSLKLPAEKYKRLFDADTMQQIIQPFGKLGLDNVYEVEGSSSHYDSLVFELLQIISSAYATRNEFCIFNIAEADIHWFLNLARSFYPATSRDVTPENHLLAMDYYQNLYEAERSLTQLNRREIENPVDKIRIKTVAEKVVHRRNNSHVKKVKSFSNMKSRSNATKVRSKFRSSFYRGLTRRK